MQNTSKKVFENLVSKTKIYLAIIFILLCIICIKDLKLIIPSIIVYIIILIYAILSNNKRKNQITETLQDFTLKLDSAAKSSLINSPFPLIIFQSDGKLIWKSSKFASEFANTDINKYIEDISIDIKAEIEKENSKKEKDI